MDTNREGRRARAACLAAPDSAVPPQGAHRHATPSAWRLRLLGVLLMLLAAGSAPLSSRAVAAGDAWATVRSQVPADRPVYRPTWLPARFRQAPTLPTSSIFVGVVYISDEGDNLLFVFGAANACLTEQALQSEAIDVHGFPGRLTTFPDACYPQIAVTWTEAGAAYAIHGNRSDAGHPAVNRDEMLAIVAGLRPVGADGQVLPGEDSQTFPETGKTVRGRFLTYWREHGGLPLNGYPLSDEFVEALEDGKSYTVQYFERVRLEYHPEAPDPYTVQLGQFGRRIHGGADPAAAARPGDHFFAETGHNVPADFYAYWEAHGGLAQFGYPITEIIRELLEDGREYEVQYFERARFERHPENDPPYDVLLGQFGRRMLAEAAAPDGAYPQTAQGVVDAFLTGYQRGATAEALKTFLSDFRRSNLPRGGPGALLLLDAPLSSFSTRPARAAGPNAPVAATLRTANRPVERVFSLVYERGRWKIDAIDTPC